MEDDHIEENETTSNAENISIDQISKEETVEDAIVEEEKVKIVESEENNTEDIKEETKEIEESKNEEQKDLSNELPIENSIVESDSTDVKLELPSSTFSSFFLILICQR